MELLIGGVAACCAGVVTNPFDVVKTRMQLQGELRQPGKYKIHYKNILHAFYAVSKADGVLALQKGLVPALWYQFVMNGIRLGIYDNFEKKGLIGKSGEVSAVKSVVTGAAAGSIGAFFGSPFYMLKTQLQAQSSGSIAVGYQHNHQSMIKALSLIWLKQGPSALWRGVTASVIRVACGSAVQLATFSKCKEFVQKSEVFKKDSWLNALIASMLSGLAVAIFMTPMDVISTRLYNQGVNSSGKGILYSGIVDCIVKVLKTENFFGLYKGFMVLFLRIGPHTILNLLFWDELRKLYIQFET
ncbi:solute carrier family 25 member 35-like [Centruroides vittatus]|uniref:solute carrier family 25 member 35-like n=1 Tax=Centruroides vittatus TaxID=120091 RepID=UPI00350FC93B